MYFFYCYFLHSLSIFLYTMIHFFWCIDVCREFLSFLRYAVFLIFTSTYLRIVYWGRTHFLKCYVSIMKSYMKSHTLIEDSILSTSCCVCFYVCVQFFLSRHYSFSCWRTNITRTLCLLLIIHLISFLITVTVTDLRAERLQKRVYPENSVLNFVKKTTVSETSNFYASAKKEEIQIFFSYPKENCVSSKRLCKITPHILLGNERTEL